MDHQSGSVVGDMDTVTARFVILLHQSPGPGRQDHWDLMLEDKGRLVTFEIPVGALSPTPGPSGESRFSGLRLADHRQAYLDYQGPVSRDRGNVQQVTAGHYSLCGTSSVGDLVEACDVVQIRISSPLLAGKLFFFAENGPQSRWGFAWRPQSNLDHQPE